MTLLDTIGFSVAITMTTVSNPRLASMIQKRYENMAYNYVLVYLSGADKEFWSTGRDS
ncbi:hypothetical protein BDV38DRAFT_247555 [Aspergillus pseudotamarii]|uniref:Uncharacterized protein n=1 Tax=Aspergillus pseudotamarii TaxID=132259 RepID=A0A5N6SVT2_ASPPS|nr:uncharacterized protein BDV38DRAFT_247555 [Aspergillus pseudotamarii]KAE8137214.1 hypothetical protein BDV38DRAFT_247555 [Aspergillus pseudotamarii]